MNQRDILLKNDWKGRKGHWTEQVANWMNMVSRIINGTHFIRGGDSHLTKDGFRFRATGSGSGSAWFAVSGLGTTTATIGEGFGQYAADVDRISDGTETVTGLSTNGTFILRATLDLNSGAWAFDSVAYVANSWLGDDSDDGDTRTWALARITVADNLISVIEQLTLEAVLYESGV